MIKIVTSEERHTAHAGPVQSEFSFSFADYNDPGNAHFGCLLVLNDHILAPGKELEAHPHHDLEIVTYVISGSLKSSAGSAGLEPLEEGSFQVLSSGTGIIHAEANPSPVEPARYLQMWFLPEGQGLPPAESSRRIPREKRIGNWMPVISGKRDGDFLRIHQDVNLFAPVLTDQEEHLIRTSHRRQHLFVVEGHVELSCENQRFSLGPGDAARIRCPDDLVIRKTGEGLAELLIVDMP